MKFKERIKCDKCGKTYKNLKIRKGKFICWLCWSKEVVIIGWWKTQDKSKKI